jgi:hypothetical protein
MPTSHRTPRRKRRRGAALLDDATPAVRRFFAASRKTQVATLSALLDAMAVLRRYQASATDELTAIRDELDETAKLIYTSE